MMRELSPVAVLAALVVVLCALPVNAHDEDHPTFSWSFGYGGSVGKNFRSCFCWNSTSNTFCNSYGPKYQHADGQVVFWRPPCNHLVNQVYSWIVAPILMCCFLFSFPFLFFVSRLCCNCCGGRKPSYGCCCPIQSVDGQPRQYPKSTTRLAKFLALSIFVSSIALSVHSIIEIGHTRTAIRDGASTINTGLEQLESTLTSGEAQLNSAVQAGYPFVTASEAQKYASAISEVLPSLNDATDHAIPEIQRWVGNAHASYSYAIVAIPLTLVVLVSILAIANVRGAVISMSAGLVSILAGCVLIIASMALGVGVTTNIVLDHYGTAVPFVVQVLEQQNVCGTQELVGPFNKSLTAFVTYVCVEKGLGNFCSQTECQANFCSSVAPTLQDASARYSMTMASVDECAGNAHCGQQHSAAQLSRTLQELNGYATTIPSVGHQLQGCSIATSLLYNNVQPALNGLNSAILKLGGYLMGLSVVLILAIFVWIYGAKRFTKPGAATRLLFVDCDTLNQPVAANFVPQQEPVKTGAPIPDSGMGTPLLPQNGVPVMGQPTPTDYGCVQGTHATSYIPITPQSKVDPEVDPIGYDPVVKPNGADQV